MDDFNVDALIEKRQRELSEIIKDIENGKLTPVKPIYIREAKEVIDIKDVKSGDYVKIIGEVGDIRCPFEFRRYDGISGKVGFIDLIFVDKVELVLWNDNCEISKQLSKNDKIEVRGIVKEYKGEPQIHVESLTLYKKLL